MSTDFDVVIVGGGVAGALCAWKLSRRQDLRILLLDAGDNQLDENQRREFVRVYATSAKGSVLVPYNRLPSVQFVQSSDTKDTKGDAKEHYFQPKEDGTTPKDPKTDEIYKSNYVRVFGGSTWAWRGNVPRLIPNDFRLKSKYGVGDDWPICYGDLEPYYCEAEREMGVSGNDEEWDGLLGAERGNPFPMRGIALSYGDRLIKAALDGQVIDGVIERVIYRNWKDDITKDVVATGRVVVVAMHGIETPRLLLHSGLANSSGTVGKYLMDHIQEDVVGLFPEPLYQFRGPQNICSIEVFRDGDFRRTCGAVRMSVGNDGGGRRESLKGILEKLMGPPERLDLFGKSLRTAFRNRAVRFMRISYSTEQLPNGKNLVKLADGRLDAFGVPRPEIHYSIDDYSWKALAYGHSVARRVFERIKGADDVAPLQPAFDYNGAGHIMGTCRMGDDPHRSVVDRQCRTHDHPNLYIAGSSVFTTGGTANPTLTLAALALRSAEAIEKALKAGV